MTLATNIRSRREARGMSLTALAHLAGVSKGYISQLENAEETRPSADILQRIAETLGTSVEALLDKPGMGSVDQTDPIPSALAEFAYLARLDVAEARMLAHIRYHGKQPQTLEDWRFLYESIRRSVITPTESAE